MLGKKKKPAPDIFLLALERANEGLKPGEEVVKPEECLVFEDSVAGVEAGRKAGMRVVWVPHKGLAGVWKGREELVLMGTTEEDSEAIRSDSSPMGDEEQGEKHEEECSPLRSRDGWAEMLTTLEDFPYTYYGIQL